MKTCTNCGETKPLDEFEIRADTGRRRNRCNDCRRVYQLQLYRRKDPSTVRTNRMIGAAAILPCSHCGELKPASEFPRRGTGSLFLQCWCRACFSAYKAERHEGLHESEMLRIRRRQAAVAAANRVLLNEYLRNHPCVDCGETDLRVLDFDHVRGSKKANISHMINSGFRWARIEEEIAKGDVRCSNDHRRVTHQRRKEREVREPAGPWKLRPRTDLNRRPTPSKGAALSMLSYGVVR